VIYFVLPAWRLAGATAAGSGGALLAVLQFGQTISVTAIVVAAGVVVLGGVFTLRNNMRSFWRDLAEERKEQIDVLEHEVRESATKLLEMQSAATASALEQAAEQREIRHALKTKVAELGHQLEIEKAKHDLSAVTERLTALEELAITRGSMFDRIDATAQQQVELLTRIVAALPALPTTDGGST
jgi:uncharacterized coiled-coil protein SlyX